MIHSENDRMANADVSIDFTTSALLVIDMQQGIFAPPRSVYAAETVLTNINSLTRKWRAEKGLLLFVQHVNRKMLQKQSPGWQLHPDLQVTAQDMRLEKQHGNAFTDTILCQTLRDRGVNQVMVTGLVSQGCVRATCLEALDLGYQVILIQDGHSTYCKDAEQVIQKWNQRLSEHGVIVLATHAVVGQHT